MTVVFIALGLLYVLSRALRRRPTKWTGYDIYRR